MGIEIRFAVAKRVTTGEGRVSTQWFQQAHERFDDGWDTRKLWTERAGALAIIWKNRDLYSTHHNTRFVLVRVRRSSPDLHVGSSVPVAAVLG